MAASSRIGGEGLAALPMEEQAMCYGMRCPHQDWWGECRGGRHCECPRPAVMDSHPVDIYECEEAPSALVAVWLEDPRYGEELHTYFQREPWIMDDGEEVEISEDEADHAVVMALWRDETHEEIVRWNGPRPEWVRDDEEEDGE